MGYVWWLLCLPLNFFIFFWGGGGEYGWPMTRSMFGLNLALQWHPWAVQVHGNGHVGTVLSRGSML